MARCSYCGCETILHSSDLPTCVKCLEKLKTSLAAPSRSIQGRLTEDVLLATAELDLAAREYNLRLGDFPNGLPHPDGFQSIRSARNKLSIAKNNMTEANSRLSDFLSDGIVPEDLKKFLP